MTEHRKVIIIGAGIGGLSAGYWLSGMGYRVQILESSHRPGGRLMTLERNGDRIDVGAQFFHNNYRYAFELVRALKLKGGVKNIKGKIQFTMEDGAKKLWNTSSPYMGLIGVRGNLKLYSFIIKYILFGHRIPLYRIARDIPEYDDIAVLDHFSGDNLQRMRDYLITPLSMGSNMGMPDWMSLYHFIHQFRVYTASGVSAFTTGMTTLADKMAELLPVEYESPVRKLVVEKGRVVGVEMKADGSIRKAGHVIVAVPPPASAELMPDELDSERQFFSSVVYSPMPMPVFFLDRPLKKKVWLYYIDPSLKRDFMFAIDAASRIPEMVPSRKAVLTAWSGHPATLDLMNLPDSDITEKARQDIELMIPGFSEWIEDTAVVRHSYGIPRYPIGAYRQVLDFQENARQLKGVSFVSALFGGSSLEASIVSATEAVNRVSQWGGTA